jgi:DNA polymerase-3 subunit epsilon
MEFFPDYVVVDLETTGLSPCSDAIIEFGAVRVCGGELADAFSQLVSPGFPVSSFITGLTGISNRMLADAPTLSQVLPEFLRFVGDTPVVGHNVSFDLGFLNAACRRVLGTGFPNDYADTMRLSRRLFPEYRHHRLCDLTERFCIDAPESHRALADVLQTRGCYEYMRRWACEHGR